MVTHWIVVNFFSFFFSFAQRQSQLKGSQEKERKTRWVWVGGRCYCLHPLYYCLTLHVLLSYTTCIVLYSKYYA